MFKFFQSNKKIFQSLFDLASLPSPSTAGISGEVTGLTDDLITTQFHDLYSQLKSSISHEKILLHQDSHGWILLQLAAMNGHTSLVNFLLQQCSDEESSNLLQKVLEYEGQSGHTAFLLSLTNGHEAIAALLLSAGSSVDHLTSRQRNSLYLISRGGFLSVAQILLNKFGENKTRQLAQALDSNGYTALHAAALMGHASLCSFLINEPIHLSIATSSRDGTNALHLACRLSSHQNSTWRSAETLSAIFHSDQFKSPPSSGVSPSLLDLLHGADCFGSTPLHLACSSLNIEAIRTILTFVTDTTALVAQDNDGYHPTHILIHEFCRLVTEMNQLQKTLNVIGVTGKAEEEEEEESPTDLKKRQELHELQEKIDCSLACLTLFLNSNYPLLATDYCQVTLMHSLANCEPSPSLVALLEHLCQTQGELESNLETFLSLKDCSGWTCMHTAYHTNSTKYEFLIRSLTEEGVPALPPPSEINPIDFFTFFSSRVTPSFLLSLNLQTPRDLLSQKVARLRCGAHNRIPLAERRSILLEDYTLHGVVNYLQRLAQTRPPRVVVLCGAGISTSAGIKDFRSSDGLYAQPSTRQLFSLEYLLTQPKEFYSQVKEMFLPVIDGVIKPTPTHLFLKILHDKGWLSRIYTQNIDMLEHEVIQHHHSHTQGEGETKERGANGEEEEEVIVECHGSFRRAYCFNSQCTSPVYVKTKAEMRRLFWDPIRRDEIPCCPTCKQFLRPDVTFFGEPLASQFGQLSMSDLPSCDMLLVMGTSLVVYPVASLPSMVSPTAVRVLLNREPTGCFQFLQPGNLTKDIGAAAVSDRQQHQQQQVETSSYRDVYFEGSCDDGARVFVKEFNDETLCRVFDQMIAERCRPALAPPVGVGEDGL
jgi:NAD+-dependent protein deacetylase sirtuin 2